MDKSIRYISISHRTAPVAQREVYHISEEEKITLADLIRHSFPDIIGLFLLSTCNRTEIYFESTTTSATVFRDFFIGLKGLQKTKSHAQLFHYSNTTEDAV